MIFLAIIILFLVLLFFDIRRHTRRRRDREQFIHLTGRPPWWGRR